MDICVSPDQDNLLDLAGHLPPNIRSLGLFAHRNMTFRVNGLHGLTRLTVSMGKVPILTLSLQEDHAIMTNLRSLEVADRVYGIDYAAGEAGDIAGLLRCCPHLKECALPVDNNVVESFSLLAALSEELEVLRLPFARFGVDFLRVVEAFHDNRCLTKLQYLHTDIEWDLVFAYIEGHKATCPLRRRICGREEVECL